MHARLVVHSMLVTLVVVTLGCDISTRNQLNKNPTTKLEPSNTELSAQDILENMARAYAECDSYRDEGVVSTIFFERFRRRTVDKPFETLFVRPNLLRFEFLSKSNSWFRGMDKYVVWADGTKIRSWWSIKPTVEEFKSIGNSLAGPTGISGGSAATIPAMLIPGMNWKVPLKRLIDAKLLGEEQVGRASCFVIDATTAQFPDRRITIWIDEQTFLLLKLFETNEFETFRTEKTTSYRPQLNVDIAKKAFAFEPPSD
jgi:outer membrane lipoprotein-sorting protein